MITIFYYTVASIERSLFSSVLQFWRYHIYTQAYTHKRSHHPPMWWKDNLAKNNKLKLMIYNFCIISCDTVLWELHFEDLLDKINKQPDFLLCGMSALLQINAWH